MCTLFVLSRSVSLQTNEAIRGFVSNEGLTLEMPTLFITDSVCEISNFYLLYIYFIYFY